jgi:hypothetical protein
MAAKYIEHYHNIAENNNIIASKQKSINMAMIIVPFLNSRHIASGSGSNFSNALNMVLKIILDLDHDQLRYIYDNLPEIKSRMDNKTTRTARILIQTILNINTYDEATQIDIARETRDKETLFKLSQSEHADTRQIATRRLRRIKRLEALV